MFFRRMFLSLFLGLWIFSSVQGQEAASLDTRDLVEIQYRAEQLVKELENLLNVISNADIYDSEVEMLIDNSFKNPQSQLFVNANAIVEDDVNPRSVDESSSQDLRIRDYLKNLDVSYQKSEDFSISFSDIEVSRVYQEPAPYVRVKYTVEFSNAHKTISDPYRPRQRLADIQIVKAGSQWKPLIAALAFFGDGAAFETETYALDASSTGLPVGEQVDQPEAGQNAAMKKEILAELKQEFERMTQAENARKANTAQTLLAEGDASFADGAFESALRAYQQAMQVNPYDTEAFKRINQAQEKIEQEKRNKEKRQIQLQDHLRAGLLAYRFRQYEAAQESYQSALDLNPRMDSIQEKIRIIERRRIELSKLEIKAKQNDLKGALRDYSRAIKETPRDVDLLVRRGLTYEKLDQPKRALEDYSDALEIYPDYHLAYVRRGFLYEMQTELRLAEADYSMALALKKDDAEMYQRRAMLRVRLKQLSQAIEDYTLAVRYQKTSGRLYLERGRLYEKQGNHDAAIADFSSMITLEPDFSDGWFERGMVYHKLKEVSLAAADFLEAQQRSLAPQAREQIQQIANNYFQQGRDFMQRKEFKEAVQPLKNAVITRPDWDEAWFHLGESQEELRDLDAATAAYSSAIKANKAQYEAHYRRGRIFLANRRLEQAAKDFDMAREIKSDFIPAQVALGNTFNAMGEYEASLEALKRALALDPDQPKVHFTRGVIHKHLKQYPAAVSAFNQAIRYQKAYPEAYFERAQAYFSQKQHSAAIKDLKKALKYKPTYPEANFESGNVYSDLGKAKKAVPFYSKAIQQQIPYPEVYRSRAMSYAAMGAPRSALDDIEAYFLKLDMEEPSAADRLFAGQQALGARDWEKAQSFFEPLLEVSDTEGDAAYGMACLTGSQGQLEEALDWIQQAFEAKTWDKNIVRKDKRLGGLLKDKRFKALL